MDSLKICFAHHLSLSYNGGGEKWVISTAKELVKRGHDVEIYSLPFLLDGKSKINPKDVLEDIPYTEGLRHNIKTDIVYVTYNPLSWLNFKTSRPRIAGIHSHAYWLPPHPNYGILPNLANIVNRFTSYFEVRRFDAIHIVNSVYPINHPHIYNIPNFVDSKKFKPYPKNSNFTVGYASRKVWQKGWSTFQQIVKKLPKKINVRVSGGILEDNMPTFLSENHLIVVPSRSDTFGLTLVESCFCGTPVVTSPLVTHKILGLPLQYASSVDEYIDVILHFKDIWENKKKYYFALSKRCREFAMKYDKTSVMNKIEQMLRREAFR